MVREATTNTYSLRPWKTVYTKFQESLDRITRSEPGDVNMFIQTLQEKVDEKLEGGNPPTTETIDALF